MHKVLRRLSMIFFIPFTVMALVILAASAVTTIYYDTDQGADLPRFGHQNFIVLIVGALLFFALVYFLMKKHREHLFPVILGLETIICLIIMFLSRAVAVTDGLTLDEIMNAFNKGDYSSLHRGGYMFVYPFQIGYVALGQIIGKVFGESNYLVFQLINLISILITVVFLHKITKELFEDQKVLDVADLMTLTMFFLFYYVVYVYNDVWSIAPGVMAIYFEICFLKRHRIRDELVAALFLGLGCVLKSNLYIAFIAMAALLLADALECTLAGERNLFRKWLCNMALIVVLAIAALIPLKLIGNAYAVTAGIESYPEGVPSSTYFAMAMQEGEGEWGWYNGFNVNTYRDNDFDREKTDKAAKAAIAERFDEFKARPLHAVRFYVRKLLSQWADPTLISVRNYELTMRHSDSESSFALSMVDGFWSKVFQAVMDVAHFMVYLGLAIFCILTIKKKSLDLPKALPVLFVFGGMLFHEIWEGSSRYVIRYFLMLLPLGAYGITELARFLFHIRDNTEISK